MDFFTKLEKLISSQDSSNGTASSVLAQTGSPSTSIAILDDGIITSKYISTIGDNADTLFQACSISKPITGMATMRLVEAGRLNLDSKIVTLLPRRTIDNISTPQTEDLIRQISVSHLVEHTSGLCVSHFSGYAPKSGETVPDTETILSGKAPANTLQVRVISPQGLFFSYSGGGMVVLQLILEAVTGKDFSSLMKELVFEPLGMDRSFFSLEDSGETNVARAHFTGYTPCDVPWHEIVEKAAAGLWTTPSDLLKAVRGMQRSLKVQGSFLSQSIAREMLSEVQDTMALSWIARKDPGNSFEHSGSNDPGWECFVMGYADLHFDEEEKEEEALDGCGISIMTNSAAGLTVWAKVFHAITYLKGWPQLFCETGRGGFGKIPFCDFDVELGKEWYDWIGVWRDEGKDILFVLDIDIDSKPRFRFRTGVGCVAVKLAPAAIPSVLYEGKGKSIDLVLLGLEMMLRLGWKDEKQNIEVWFDGLPLRVVNFERDE